MLLQCPALQVTSTEKVECKLYKIARYAMKASTVLLQQRIRRLALQAGTAMPQVLAQKTAQGHVHLDTCAKFRRGIQNHAPKALQIVMKAKSHAQHVL